MEAKSSDELVLAFADMLVQKQVDTKIISDALTFLCDAFSFDFGCVYEIDQYNYMNLKEHYVPNGTNLRERFKTEEIPPPLYGRVARETISCLSRSGGAPADLALLELFSASSLVLYPVVDENYRILGLTAFAHADSAGPLPGEDQKTLNVLLSMLGRYTILRMYQNKLAFAQNSLESILDNTGIDIYVNDFYTHDILYVNQSMAAPYGGISQFLGNKCWEVLFPGQSGPCEFCPQKKLVDEHGDPTYKVYSWNYQRPFDGAWFRVFSAAFRWVDGRLAHVVSSADITENKKNEELIRYMANYDSLTKLPNRRMLVSECERRISQVEKDRKGYLLFFDIDGFKAINDEFGHESGDAFLVQLGEFFSGIPMLKDAIYRNGGDEFVAILDGDVTEANIRSLAGFIHKRFQKPWVLKNGNVFCNTSIGVACYPEDGKTAEELLHTADQSMYQVKKSGGGNICFGYQLKP